MKKTAKDKEIEKLKKQVEELKSEKNALKQKEKSLNGKLSTARTKIEKYRNALKKKSDAERSFGFGDLRINDESIGRHQYSTLIVALSVAFYTRLHVGSRQVVEIFNILNEFMGDIFGKVPAYTTIGYWAQELGLSVYKESCDLLKNKRYALIIDESMMIGSEKLLLTLAVSADNEGHAISEEDIVIVDISIAKSWNGTTIKEVLEKVAEKIGHDPEYVISDNGSTIGKAVRDAGYKHHLDVSHSLGMFLERVYKNEPDFQEFSKKVSDARLKYNMQDAAFLQPPSQRSIARFMNMSKWIEWASRMQYVYHTLQDDIKSIYQFIPQNASLVDELSEAMNCITKIEKDVKVNGISYESAARCEQLVRNTLMSGCERLQKLGTYILGYLNREISFMDKEESHNASTDTIESTFGVIKARKSDDGLAGVTPFILMIPLRLHFADKTRRVEFNFKERLEVGRHRHIKEWTDVNLSPNLVVKRLETIGKKCVGF